MERDFWNDRFSGEEYVFGTAPAAFLPRIAGLLPPGATVLSIADGEGRNSTWLAEQGFSVTAFDLSPAAVAKARALDAVRGVQVERQVCGLEAWNWTRSFDVVVGVFFQFLSPEARAAAFEDIARGLRSGGILALHGYAPRQVGYGTGGPGVAENLYEPQMLRAAFPGWRILRLEDFDAEIHEGTGHVGLSALVDFVAEKPR